MVTASLEVLDPIDPLRFDSFGAWYDAWRAVEPAACANPKAGAPQVKGSGAASEASGTKRTDKRVAARLNVPVELWRKWTQRSPEGRRAMPADKLQAFTAAFGFSREECFVLRLLVDLESAAGAEREGLQAMLHGLRKLKIARRQGEHRAKPPPGHWVAAAITELPRIRVVSPRADEVGAVLAGRPDPGLVRDTLKELLAQELVRLNAGGQIVEGAATYLEPAADANDDERDFAAFTRHMSILDHARDCLRLTNAERGALPEPEFPRDLVGLTVALSSADVEELGIRLRAVLGWAFARSEACETPDRVVHAECMILPLTRPVNSSQGQAR